MDISKFEKNIIFFDACGSVTFSVIVDAKTQHHHASTITLIVTLPHTSKNMIFFLNFDISIQFECRIASF